MKAMPIERIISIATFFKSFFFSEKTQKVMENTVDQVLKAHHKGDGQADERLTLTSFARAINLLTEEPYNLQRKDATNRIIRILTIINSYNPEEIRCISLTFGLEQTTKKVKRTKTYTEDGDKEKENVLKTSMENVDGQAMAVMLAYHDDEKFTREFCDFAISSTKLLKFKVDKVQKIAIDFIKKSDVIVVSALDGFSDSLKEIFKNPVDKDGNEVTLFRAPAITKFILFNRKKKIAQLEKEYYEKMGVTKW